jgi:hypothetical protein
MLTATRTGYRNRPTTEADLDVISTVPDDLLQRIERLLTWGKLTDFERAQLTQAANAAELCGACLRLHGPRKPVTIGY